MSEAQELPRCPQHGDTLHGLQYCLTPQDYDGISEWFCPQDGCRYRIGRWSGAVLQTGEIERRYGGAPVRWVGSPR